MSKGNFDENVHMNMYKSLSIILSALIFRL